jgi:hypothetical protein
MKNFKAVAMDYEYYLTLGDEGQLYCLTDRQVYILLVQLEYVGWLTRWYNTDDITQTEVGFIQSELMEKLMSCVDVSVLVNQGKLNLTSSVQNQQIQSTGLRKIYEDRYDGDPTSINPDAPTTDFGATGDRYDALCAAITAFVYQFAKSQAEAVIAADITAFALLAGVAILLIPGLNLFFIAGAALALVAGGGIIGVTTAVAVEALTDTDALGEVICFMRDTLAAESVSQANWDACLDSYPFSVGSHAAIIADFIKPTLHDNYLPVLDMLGQAYSGTINGDPLPECPCEPPPPGDCVDLTASVDTWVASPDSAFGLWHAGQGLGPGSGGGGTYFNWVRDFNGPGTIVRIRFTFSESMDQMVVNVPGKGAYFAPTTTDVIDIDATNAPSVLPFDQGAFDITITRIGNVVPTDFRIIEVCVYLAP